ncbi:AI-2E family transporter [Terrilactibacillus sp. BCM23-1]|uniref:AI-2E family transporter n=1 Tax=Terrilactibacillus tamarindi TaxID=2599694 RepID=A0A6N8CNC7_9BACI|nr:AI-2E family transporter [Terrilactibacillus tamarindi]MTT31148.1 AI-2E family transporter [Terrilactibacillus tamarindi]
MDVLVTYIQKHKSVIRRILIFALLIFILFLLRSLIDLILLTFIFTFLIDRLETVVHRTIKIPRKLVVVILYLLIVLGIYIAVTIYLPIITEQTLQLYNQTIDYFKHTSHSGILNLVNLAIEKLQQYHVDAYLKSSLKIVLSSFSQFGSLVISFFLALLLSLFFSLEKERLIHFSRGFKNSKIGFLYDELAFFGSRFVGTFGKVLEAQFLIAIVNTAVTAIVLWFLHFPQLFSLIIMVFVLSLIPVAGVVISLIPLCIIGYTIGGFKDVVYMVLTILIVHALEAYILNPKLMSSKTDLPVFYTFVVLIFSEHFFGIWGLIVGIPVFVFLIDVLGVNYKRPAKKIRLRRQKE